MFLLFSVEYSHFKELVLDALTLLEGKRKERVEQVSMVYSLWKRRESFITVVEDISISS